MCWSVLKARWSIFLYLVTELLFKKCTACIPVLYSSASKNDVLALRGEALGERCSRFRSFPSSGCLGSDTSALLPPKLGRKNTGYCTPRQELPSSESTAEVARWCWETWAQAEPLPRPRGCRAAPPPGGVSQRDRSPWIQQRCLVKRTVPGCIHPHCLKLFTSYSKKPFYTFSLRILGNKTKKPNLFIVFSNFTMLFQLISINRAGSKSSILGHPNWTTGFWILCKKIFCLKDILWSKEIKLYLFYKVTWKLMAPF